MRFLKKLWVVSLVSMFLFIGGLYVISIPVDKPAVTTQFPNTIQGVLPNAVHIMCDRWQGSGVALTNDIVVTARHVVLDGKTYIITLNDGRTVKGVQTLIHKDYDIAFIKVEEPILTPAKFGSIKECVLGQPVFIVGSPFGKINFNNVTLGIISGLDKDWDSLSRYGEPYGWKVAFTSDSGAHPGNSGGGVFSLDGICRGLLVGGFSPVLNCSMPCDLFLNDIENIKTLFAMKKYKSEEETKQIDYSYTVESREDYYIWD